MDKEWALCWLQHMRLHRLWNEWLPGCSSCCCASDYLWCPRWVLLPKDFQGPQVWSSKFASVTESNRATTWSTSPSQQTDSATWKQVFGEEFGTGVLLTSVPLLAGEPGKLPGTEDSATSAFTWLLSPLMNSSCSATSFWPLSAVKVQTPPSNPLLTRTPVEVLSTNLRWL